LPLSGRAALFSAASMPPLSSFSLYCVDTNFHGPASVTSLYQVYAAFSVLVPFLPLKLVPGQAVPLNFGSHFAPSPTAGRKISPKEKFFLPSFVDVTLSFEPPQFLFRLSFLFGLMSPLVCPLRIDTVRAWRFRCSSVLRAVSTPEFSYASRPLLIVRGRP